MSRSCIRHDIRAVTRVYVDTPADVASVPRYIYSQWHACALNRLPETTRFINRYICWHGSRLCRYTANIFICETRLLHVFDMTHMCTQIHLLIWIMRSQIYLLTWCVLCADTLADTPPALPPAAISDWTARALGVPHCNTLQHAATHCTLLCNSLQLTLLPAAIRGWNTCTLGVSNCKSLQLTATHCNTLQHTATRCIPLQITASTASDCNSLQLTATHCKSLQLTATRCHSLKPTPTHNSAYFQKSPLHILKRTPYLFAVA